MRLVDALDPWDGSGSGAQGRARLLILFALTQVGTSIGFLAMYAATDASPILVAISLISLAIALISLLVLRVTRSTAPAAALVLGYIALSTFGVGLTTAGSSVAWSPWWAALPLLGTALARRRCGAAMMAVSVAAIVGLFTVHATGNAIVVDAELGDHYLISTLGSNAATALVWLFAWLYDRTRDGVLQDLRQALDRLRASDAHRAALFDNAPSMVCALDADLAITEVNDAMKETWRRLFDVPIPLGTRFVDLLPCEATTQARWNERLRRAREGERIEAIEAIDTLVGRRLFDTSLAPVRAAGRDPSVLGVAVYAIDVTDRLESDARQQRTNAHLVDLSRRAGMAEVATGILHDLGNTLNSVTVNADHLSERLRRLRLDRIEMLADRLANPDLPAETMQRYVRALAADLATQRATLLEGVDTLLSDVMRVRSQVVSQRRYAEGNQPLVQTNLREVAEQVLAWHRIRLARSGVEVTVSLGDMPDTRLERSVVLQLLDGLLSNAQLGFDTGCPTRPRLAMEGATHDGRCRIVVSDNGLALPERVEPGTRPSDDPRWARLQACHALARELGGRLAVACTETGNRFTFEVPASRTEHQVMSRHSASGAP